MKRLNPDKLYVEFRDNATKDKPIKGRKYTLTHSDITGELFLTIGLKYAYDKISSMRDEVLAMWELVNNNYILHVYVYLDGNPSTINLNKAVMRNQIFVRELPLALETIRYGDNILFETHPKLNNAPIYVYFASIYPCLNRIEYWGTPSDYE